MELQAALDVPFLDVVKGHIRWGNDVWGDDDGAWIDCMQKHGIATELQDAVMDPRFKQLRLTCTCVQWLLHAIDMRYESIEYMHSKSDSGNSFDTPNTENEHPDHTVAPGNNLAPEETPRVTVLYKAIVLDRRGNTSWPLLDSDGRLEVISHLSKHRTIVFDRSGSVIYLGTSLETAQLHASYLRTLSNGLDTNVVIVRIQIPYIALKNTSVPIYFPSDDWKKLVWYCQGNGQNTELRNEVSRLYRAPVKVGNLTSRPKEAFSELGSWEGLTEKHVLKLNGNTDGDAYYGFKEDGGEDFLEDHVTDGKIAPFSTEEYLQWMEAHQDLSQRDIARSHYCLQ